MTQYTKDPVLGLVGVVGKPPERKTSREKGTPFLVFSLAVSTGYDESDKSTWYDVSVFNEGLIESVAAELYKGAKVAVEGFYSTREYNGNTYHQLRATKVGLVEWLARTPGQARQSAPAAPAPARPVAAPVVPTGNDFDALPF